jgi:4-aminobutyrate aminotransferase-like enzyme
VVQAAFEDDLLLLTCGTHSNVVRWIPPLVTSEAQTEQAIETFRHALENTGDPAGA